MVYLSSVNEYLHQSSLLLSAYQDTVRITTKYTLPRTTPPPDRPIPANKISKSKPQKSRKTNGEAAPSSTDKEKKPKIASLTFKTYEPDSGICLKYTTDKQAEVGRLMLGLGKLAAGESIEEPSNVTATGADKMDIDGAAADGAPASKEEPSAAAAVPPPTAAPSGNAGGKKKKKGKK